MTPRPQNPTDTPTKKLPWFLFPLVALPLYPLVVIFVAPMITVFFTRPIPPLLPQWHTLIEFPIQFPWCLFTLLGVLCAMLLARLPAAGLIIGLCQCASGWLLYRILYPPPGRFSGIGDIFMVSSIISITLAYAITSPLLVSAYRRFFVLPTRRSVARTPASPQPSSYDY